MAKIQLVAALLLLSGCGDEDIKDNKQIDDDKTEPMAKILPSSGCKSVADCLDEAVLAAHAAQRAAETAIPSKAVIAFELADCPTGWTRYRPAYGRFIRGFNPGDNANDLTDIGRKLGDLQEDEVKRHSHPMRNQYDKGPLSGAHAHPYIAGKQSKPERSEDRMEGGAESRPKNVALLYCQKT